MILVVTPSFGYTRDALLTRYPKAKSCVRNVLDKLPDTYHLDEIRYTYVTGLEIRLKRFVFLEGGILSGQKEE